jgi:hypothetical protein
MKVSETALGKASWHHAKLVAQSPRIALPKVMSLNQVRTLSDTRIKAARAVGVCADLIQIGLPYIFGEGFLSPFQDVLDVLVCVAMTLLVGWHHAFIPTFLVELVPFGDLAPTWTIAAFIATRRTQRETTPTMKAAVVTEDKRVA